MANVKISQLPAASTPLAGTEEIPLVQGGITKQVTVDGLLTSANLGTPSVINLTYATNVPVNEATGVLPVANGGTGAATAAAGIENLLPSYSGNASKRLGLNSGATALEWVSDGGGTVTSVGMSVPSFLSVSGSPVTSSGTLALSYSGTALPVANGGTGTTTSTGTGSVVLSSSPTLVTPALGTPSAAILTNATGLPISTGVSGLGTGVATFLATPSSANLAAAVSDETGSGALVFATSPTLVTPALGTPTSGDFSTGSFTWPTFNQNTTGTAANITATSNSTLTTLSALSLPGSQVSGNISGNAANVTGVVAVANGGTGTSTPSLVQGSNITITGTWPNQTIAATAGGSGTVTSVSGTGTVSGITLTGTVTTSGSLTLGGTLDLSAYNGAGAFTTLSASGNVTLSGGTANGVTYLNGSKVLTSGSALTFDGTNFVVGAGTTPSYKLCSYSASGNQGITIANGGNAGGDFCGFDFWHAGAQKAVFYTNSNNLTSNVPNGQQIFQIGNSEQMRLTSTGLGIGTSSPTQKLQVAGAVRVSDAATEANALQLSSTSTTSTIETRYNYPLLFGTNATERMRLDTSGNLGLGVTPSASSVKTFEIGAVGLGLTNRASGKIALLQNAYFNSGFKYAASGMTTAMYEVDNGSHYWYNAPSGTAGNTISFTQAMTLDADGELGVGTTSPTAKVHAYSGTAMKQLTVDGAGAIKTGINFASGGTTYGQIYFDNNSPYDMSVLQQYSTGSLIFGTNNTERARIDSSGNLLVGVTSGTYHTMYKDHADWALMARNGNANPYGVAIRYSGAAPNGAANNFLEMYDTSTTRAKFTSNGGLANYSANNVNLSDRREKTNFAPAGSYLDKICAIPVQTYNYIDQNLEQDDGLTLGVVAQDVQAVAPELVNESNWGSEEEPKMRLSIYQTDLQYALMKALQELKAEFDAYKASHP